MKEIKLGLSREDLHRLASERTEEHKKHLADWLKTRPEHVQDAAKRIDMLKVQRIKEDAPYRFTGEGTIGTVIGFREDTEKKALVGAVFIAHVLCPNKRDSFTPDELAKIKALNGPLETLISIDHLEPDPPPDIKTLHLEN